MTEIENGGLGEPLHHPLNATQIFAGPNDGLSQTYNGISTFVGLQGHSQKAGYRRLFPTLDMGSYLEIAEKDIVEIEELSPAVSPFGTLGGMRVSVREAVRITTAPAASRADEIDDEFDLDIRLGASGWSVPPGIREGTAAEAIYFPGREEEGGKQAEPVKKTNTCETCKTCQTCADQNTCKTCADQCVHTGGANTCCKKATCF